MYGSRTRNAVICSLLGAGILLGTMPAVWAAESGARDVEVEFRYFVPKISGSVAGKDFYSERTDKHEIEFDGDLGIDDASAPEVKLSCGKWEADYIRLRSSKDQYRLRGVLEHKKHVYKGNMDTDLDMDYLSLNWKQPIKSTELGEAYWSLGAKYIRENVKCTGINADDKPESDTDSASGIIPAVGIGGKAYLGGGTQWQINGYLNGIPLGSHGHVLDFEAGISYLPTPKWRIAAGYRNIELKLRKDAKTASYKASGPFLGISYAF